MTANLFDTYFPFDAGAGAVVTEARWTEAFRRLANTGVVSGLGDELEVTTVSALTVRVAAGAAWIEGHYASNDGTTDHTLGAAHATLGRIDRVIARVDWTANTMATDVLAGAASADPEPPALTQSATVWEIPLAQVSVAALQTNLDAGDVFDERDIVVGNVPPLEPTPIRVVTGGYQLVYSDRFKLVEMAAAGLLYVPANSVEPFKVGDQVTLLQTGTGAISIEPRVGVTINGASSLPLATRVRWSAVTLFKRATDTWVAIGDLA